MSLTQSIKKGETIFKEGSFSECAFIIESGRVEISETDTDGEKKILGILTENDIFGEMGLIDNMPRSATATAIEDTVISVLTRESFETLSKQNPDALMPLLKVLSARLRETIDQLKQGYKWPDKDRRSRPNS